MVTRDTVKFDKTPRDNAGLEALQEENRRLRRAVEKLALLNDLAREISGSLQLPEIMQTTIRRALRAVDAEQGVISLVLPDALEPLKTLVRTRVSSSDLQPFHLEQNLQATIRAQTLAPAEASACLHRANRLLCRSTAEACNFITLFYGILDFHTRRFSCANAGHHAPLLFSRDQSWRELECRGMALGVMDEVAYAEAVVAFQPGKVLVIYSDGVSEAMNGAQEEFGKKRLLQVVQENFALSPHALLERILQSVKQHAGKAPQSDDMTLMIIRKTDA